ncbi:MAG: penicillin-binding protein 2 [Gorillibacterium sp.]|nr:penicillin-binding protein 2 [Gorillibacterium sp.]
MHTSSDLDDQNHKREGKLRRHFSFRINIFFFVTFVLFSTLIVKLAYVQFVEGPGLLASTKKPYEGKVYITPVRGNIYDKNEAPIATSRSTQTLFFETSRNDTYESNMRIAQTLHQTFNKYGSPSNKKLTAEQIFDSMDTYADFHGEERQPKQRHYWPRRIKSDLTNEEIAYIAEHKDELPGLDIMEESIREYEDDPNKQLAVQLVGYMGKYSGIVDKDNEVGQFYRSKKDSNSQNNQYANDYVGVDGLEYMYEDVLRGKSGSKIYPINSRQEIVGEVEITYPEKGQNLYLTIDRNVQLAGQNAIKETIAKMKKSTNKYEKLGSQATTGYAVAIEVDTGRVVAMINYPDYTPVDWYSMTKEKYQSILNLIPNGTIRDRRPNIQDPTELSKRASSLVPLGSTIKPLSVLLGLKEGLFNPDDSYRDTGILEFGRDNNAKITNSEKHAVRFLTPTTAIKVSSNTFMGSMVGLGLYNRSEYYKSKGTTPTNIWDQYMKSFGLGELTGTGLLGEYKGYRDYMLTESSSVQSNLVMASFGQGAKYTTMQLAQYTAMLANKGKRMKPLFVDKITTYDNKVTHTYKDDIKVLNTVDFTATQWKTVQDGMRSDAEGFPADYPLTVARKTGTSQSSIARQDINNATFIAYAPIEKPKLAVAVVVPEGGYGRYGAAPVARAIFDAYFGIKMEAPKDTENAATGVTVKPNE